MTRLEQSDFDRLPQTFALETARKELNWQGTNKGLKRLLTANGFSASEYRPGRQFVWIRLESAAEHGQRVAQAALRKQIARIREAADRVHADRKVAQVASASDPIKDMAERTLRLVTSLRPVSTDMVDRLDELVQRAGPAHARAFLENYSPDDGVPF